MEKIGDVKHRQAVHFVAVNYDGCARGGIMRRSISCMQFHVFVVCNERVSQMRADAVNPIRDVWIVGFHYLILILLVEAGALVWRQCIA